MCRTWGDTARCTAHSELSPGEGVPPACPHLHFLSQLLGDGPGTVNRGEGPGPCLSWVLTGWCQDSQLRVFKHILGRPGEAIPYCPFLQVTTHKSNQTPSFPARWSLLPPALEPSMCRGHCKVIRQRPSAPCPHPVVTCAACSHLKAPFMSTQEPFLTSYGQKSVNKYPAPSPLRGHCIEVCVFLRCPMGLSPGCPQWLSA